MEIGSVGSMSSSMAAFQQATASQQSEPPDSSEMASKFMEKLDSDGDGSLSESEISASGLGENESMTSSEKFDELDTNEDGVVSQEELQADMEAHAPSGPPPDGASGISGIDASGDSSELQSLLSMTSSSSSSSTSQSEGTALYEQVKSLAGSSTLSQTLSASA
jgi:Ca2+-binding EF-hand superfamily protein